MQRVLFEHLFLCDTFTSRKVSAVLFLKKKAPLRIFFPIFLKDLLQLFQSTLMKRSMTEFGSAQGR